MGTLIVLAAISAASAAPSVECVCDFVGSYIDQKIAEDGADPSRKIGRPLYRCVRSADDS